MENLYNIGEAAEILGVSQDTLRRWDNNGKFKSIRHPINNYRVYSDNQIKNLVQEMQAEIFYKPLSVIRQEIKPFFQTGFGELYHCDSVHFLQNLESNSVDLIFADPPYNIKKAEWDYFHSQREYLDWTLEWVRESQRVLKKTGSLYICGFSEILADIKYVASPLFKNCRWLVWYYRNKANLGKDWGRSHESIIHFRKTNNFVFNIDEVRIPYNGHTVKYPKRTQAETSQYANGQNGKSYEWEPNPLGAKPKDVLEIPTISNGAWEKYPHETQKPVELLRKIILSSSMPDSCILDPFGGSGTTYAVAEAYQRKWIGIEKELDYCNVIRERLSDRTHISRIASARDEADSQKRRQSLRGK
ncbi:MAG: MerR family transcriptional regulator [Tannerella sp.]|jgi:site-specific DNA-methyltransferase (adenine-specific)|nr:MerR family transcriptional regulator [Tannerella sp.]